MCGKKVVELLRVCCVLCSPRKAVGRKMRKGQISIHFDFWGQISIHFDLLGQISIHFDFLSFPQPSWRDGTRQVSPPGLLENDL